ncbi:MAG: nucleotidyltransferase family protein [Rhodobacteraceae bacterium]|nr:nucleotidyltransferase family protein [Paracoccaceae bacterium]
MTHLRYAHLPEPELREVFLDILGNTSFLRLALETARCLNLPDWWIVSGALYNTVWNHLTDRPEMHGIKDIDLFYFDPDTSWEAEDRVIKSATGFADNPPIEIRNQARVHLWYEKHFGRTITPLTSCKNGIDRFACKTHCVGLRLEPDNQLTLYAPYGLRDIFAFNIVPNPIQDNRKTHIEKAARARLNWPEITVVPWPEK